MSLIDSATTIIDWLKLATDNTYDGKRVKERYKMNSKSWQTIYRPDCNMETALAFLKVWKYTNDDDYLQLSRDIYDSIIKLRNSDNSFPFANTLDTHVYTNDNSEVPIFLFRMAEIDTERANMYRQSALLSTDFLITLQNADGSWRVVDNDLHKVPMFVAHAVSALSTAYKYTDKKEQYKTAIENGLDWIINGNIFDNGRVKICYEVNKGTEYWRPPSSDQAIVIRGFALAELYVDSSKKDGWKQNRIKMLNWFDQLLDSSGAIKNGLGENLNGADLAGLTDHVYTTAFGIEAYYWSYLVDNNVDYLNKAKLITEFCSNNLYYSDDINANGVIRGAYNIQDDNWDTSKLILNGGQEGGSNMVYTGWANAPLAICMFDINDVKNISNKLKIFNGKDIIEFTLNDNTLEKNSLHLCVNEKIKQITLVDKDDVDASNVRVYTNKKIMALKK